MEKSEYLEDSTIDPQSTALLELKAQVKVLERRVHQLKIESRQLKNYSESYEIQSKTNAR